jgi:hypothetical protein
VPFPLPDAPEVTISHDALLTVVQGHPAEAVTGRAPFPMSDATKVLGGLRLKEHPPTIVVGSAVLAVADPPSETLTWFVTWGGAFEATLTVTVIGG